MADEITPDVIAREKALWNDVVKRLDFLTEMAIAKTDKVMVKDAGNKLVSAMTKHRSLFKQRMLLEFTGTKA